MTWKQSVFSDFKLYGVTDIPIFDKEVLKKIEMVYEGGADIIQLRSKCLNKHELCELGSEMRRMADFFQKLYFVNDFIDLALETKADGIHVGQQDTPIQELRLEAEKFNHPLWIGKSTHEIAHAREAVLDGADYIGVGPVFETPTKPGKKAVGFEYIQEVNREINIPFVCIGGINLENVDEVIQAGAKRVAVVRGLFDAENPRVATEKFVNKLNVKGEKNV